MLAALECLKDPFPTFYRLLQMGKGDPIEELLPGATEEEIVAEERRLGVPLPDSYKRFLHCTRGFWLRGGIITFGPEMPFFHGFTPLDQLTPLQREQVRRKGGQWPPPSQGMLCIAEWCRYADGDQVLLDVARGMTNGEYPVMYYDHEAYPAAVERLADSFTEWLEELLAGYEVDETSSDKT